MTDVTDTDTAAAPTDRSESATGGGDVHTANHLTLEIVFLCVVGLVVLWALVEALGYAMVSARTPFVIMAPLFILIVIHASRLWRVRGEANFGERLRTAAAGRIPSLNQTLGLCGWMLALLAAITVFGHYVGIAAFAFILMRVLSRESLKLAVIVTLATTAAMWLVFEIGFDVELYRGLLIRYFQGFRDF